MLIEDFISADSHVVEPADLWVKRMNRRFRARAPRFERGPQGDHWLADGLNGLPIGTFGPMVSKKAEGGIRGDRGLKRRHEEETRAGATNPEARILDHNADQIEAEVVYPGLSITFFGIPDAEYQRKCIRVYNDWLAEFCTCEPKRLLGTGILPTRGPAEWATEEARRRAKLG